LVADVFPNRNLLFNTFKYPSVDYVTCRILS